MKKLIALTLALCLMLALAGCSFLYPTTPAADTAVPEAAAEAAETAETAEAGAQTGLLSWDMFNWFQIAISVYLLYACITGKGKLFENKYTKCDYKVYLRNMRIFCAVAAVLIAAGNVLELLKVFPEGSLGYWLSWAIGLASIVGVAVYNVVMTDRKAMKEAEKAIQVEQKKHDPLRAAFVFDDEEDDKSDLGDK